MQTIGERLEEARKKKGISIREAAEATKIRGDYLQKFESNHFDIGLTEIYTRGFLRTYANFLKVPADRILNDYAALGRGDVRPRQPSREVYGRMDISVSTAGESSERAAPPDEAGAEASSPRAQPQPRYPRTASSLPTGPDPAVVFRYVKWGLGGVAVLLILLILRACLSDSTPARTASTPPPSQNTTAQPATTATPTTQMVTLIANDAVFVRVCVKNPDDSEGPDLFRGTLARGQTHALPWTGPLYINASAGENLMIEVNGRRFPSGFTGNNRSQLKAPAAR